MRRMRARWVLGLLVVSSASALSCGSADTANLFTGASVTGGGAGASSAGESNHSGAGNIAGDSVGGAPTQSGGSGGSGQSGAPHGGSGMGTSGAAAGGSSGTSGSSGHGGSAGSAGTAGSAGSGPASCTSNAGCALNEYCAKADCADQTTGTCTAKPTDCANVVAATLCGCDGLTYHDACLLHLNGQNSAALQSPGAACAKAAAGTVTCSTLNSIACTAKAGVCSNKAEACGGPQPADAPGVCWILPETCPTTDPKPVLTCSGENTCRSECSVLKSKARYALSDSCTSG